MGERVFTEVAVAGAPSVSVAVDPNAGDPVADWFLGHDWIDEPVQRAFLCLVEPGMRVLDLGCHLGTFSLPAAALGASVLAVDAAGSHVELLTAAAERNGFHRLRVLQRAISDSREPIQFVERSIHGHVALPGEPGTLAVAPATVDELLEEHGWDGVELIKMDIEGMETVALAGMSRLHAGGGRPMMVFECNATMLARAGSSICELRERISELGYELLMVDHLNPGTLVETHPGAVQPECVCDYVAVLARPPRLAREWRIEPPFTVEQTVSRLLDVAAGEGGGYRAYAAAVLAGGPSWLRAHGNAEPALRALRRDVEPAVRDACDTARAACAGREHTAAAEPDAGGPPADMLVWAHGLAVRRRAQELERPLDANVPELLLSGATFHLRVGGLLAVLSDRDEAASALLRVLAGSEEAHGGELLRRGPAVLLARLGEALEGALTVAENIAVLGSFLGCAVAEAERRAPQIAALAGLEHRLEARVDDLDAPATAGLALTAVLELTTPRLLLVDRLPAIAAEPLRSWLRARVWQLRQAGGGVVQVLAEPDALLAPADCMLWISGGSIVCSGHPASVLEARWRARLGLDRASLEVASA